MSKKKYTEKAIAPLYSPRTKNQKTYVNCLQDPKTKIVLGVGPAGSGKTLFACNVAVEELKKGAIQKIILTRPAVTVEEELGYLPGTILKKMDPWTRPLFDILLEFYSQKDIDSMLHGGTIEISPLAYMRGRTFKRAFIIADEMQNSSPNQMVMLTTRIGEQSKMVITGDLFQSDRGPNNGLADFLQKLKKFDTGMAEKEPAIRYVELENEDIQRSPIVSKIVNIYNPKKEKPIPTPENTTIKTRLEPIKSTIIKDDAAMIPLSQEKIDLQKQKNL
jgi:phosphate starvation-inducible PhoH-like protein